MVYDDKQAPYTGCSCTAGGDGVLELNGRGVSLPDTQLITKTWFLLLEAYQLVITQLVRTVASVLLTHTQEIARGVPPSHVCL